MNKAIAAVLIAAINVGVSFVPARSLAQEAASNSALTGADINGILAAAQSGFQGLPVIRNDNFTRDDLTFYQVDKPIGRFAGCLIAVKKQNTRDATLYCTVLVADQKHGGTVNTYWPQFKDLLRQTLSSGWSYSIPRVDNGDTVDTLQATKSGSDTIVRTWLEFYDVNDVNHLGQPAYHGFISVTSNNAHLAQ